MSDKTLYFAMFSGLLAGLLQVFTVLVLNLKLTPVRYVGFFGFSAIFGGCITVVSHVSWHLDLFLAGVAGTLSGAMPAVIVSLMLTKTVMKRLSMEAAELNALLPLVEGESHA